MSAGDPNLQALRKIEGPSARPPLFLVAAPGINALGYVALARCFPEDQPVYAVQPKRRGRTFPDEGIGPGGRDEYPLVAAEYLASIRTVQPRGSYQIAGMCDGALLAFHMARQIEAEGDSVSLLGILDTWPLENTTVRPLMWWKSVRRGWDRRRPTERREILLRKAREALAWGAARIVPRAPAPGAGEPSATAIRTAALRAKLWPGRGFVPPRIRAPIAVLRVPEQPYWRVRDDALGWRARTTGVVTVHILPGDHFNWSRAPQVDAFGRTLSAYLAGADAEGARSGLPGGPPARRGAVAG